MSFGIFLNFEKVSLNIIEDEIRKMTDDNVHPEEYMPFVIDEVKFTNNLYHGVIAATFIVNLYETALNTIVCKRLGCSEEEILKTSHNIKLQLICTMYNVELSEIKSNNSYAIFQKISKLRNDITHYKNNEVAIGHFISSETKIPMGTSRDSLAKMFTKTYMTECFDGVLALLKLICEKCGLVLNTRCGIIDCDGRDCLCEFVVTQKDYDEGDRYMDFDT